MPLYEVRLEIQAASMRCVMTETAPSPEGALVKATAGMAALLRESGDIRHMEFVSITQLGP